MNARTSACLLFPFLLASAEAQFDSQHLKPETSARTEASFTCDRLRLYPIMADARFREASKEVSRAVPMNKALQDGRLKINEHAQGAQVNTLQAKNTSSDTIYLMQGELVIGGQQDRIMAKDVLVPPGATMDIAAFCVEHGRWEENGTGQQFKASTGVVTQEVRKAAAVEKQQVAVWDKVAKNVEIRGARSSSGTYNALLMDKQFQETRNKYVQRLKDLPASASGIVGVVAVSGDKVIGCDVFASEVLFSESYSRLLDAYVMEALNNGAPVTMTAAEVQTYFEKLFANESQLEERMKGKGYLFKAEDRTYRVSAF